MKTICFALSIVFALFISSCSSDSSSGNNPFIPGGGGSVGNVTFTVTVVQDPQNLNYFQFTPSASVTIDSIVANCPQLQIVNAVVTGDGTTVFTPTDPPQVQVDNLATGQVWSFVIAGKVGSSTGSGYSSNASYTVQ